jgi:hypothetical protein
MSAPRAHKPTASRPVFRLRSATDLTVTSAATKVFAALTAAVGVIAAGAHTSFAAEVVTSSGSGAVGETGTGNALSWGELASTVVAPSVDGATVTVDPSSSGGGGVLLLVVSGVFLVFAAIRAWRQEIEQEHEAETTDV